MTDAADVTDATDASARDAHRQRRDRLAALADQVADADEAGTLIHLLAERHGLATAWWTRADVESCYDHPLTDAEWERVKSSKAWREATWVDDEATPGALLHFLAGDSWPEVDEARADAAYDAGWDAHDDSEENQAHAHFLRQPFSPPR